MSDLKVIKDTLLRELQDGLIEILLHMKQQIFNDLIEYFSGTNTIPQRVGASTTPPLDSKCEATLSTGPNKGVKCLNKAKDNTLFCGRHKRAATANGKNTTQPPRRCKAIVHNYTLHKKQCEHLAKPGSSFCGIHRSYRPNGINTVPEVFDTLHDKDESIRKLREAQPFLNRLKEKGSKILIPADCVAIPSTHPDMFERGRENLAREIKQEVAELRVAVLLKEKEEKMTEVLLDKPPTKKQIEEAEESGMIPLVYRKWNIQCRMVNERIYPILPNGCVKEAWDAIRTMTSEKEYNSLKELQVKHPHIYEWRTIVSIGCYCEEREKYRATPNCEKNEKFESTINGKVPLTNKQKMEVLGLNMRAHEEDLKKRGIPYVPSDVAAKMPNELLEERERLSRRKPEEFFDPSDHPHYQTNTIKKTIYVHKNWDSRDNKILEKLQDGQRVKRSTFSNNLVIKNKDNPFEVEGYDSDCSKASVAEDYFPRFIECLTPRSKKYEVWNSRIRY